MTRILFVIAITFLFTFFVFYFGQQFYINSSQRELKFDKKVTIGGAHFLVDFSKTDKESSRGLSKLEKLLPDQGLLMFFQYENDWGIWMKDMNFPIDIVWINKNKEVSYIRERISPNTYPEIFYPPGKELYVLELPAGTVEMKHIKVGDLLLY